MDLTSTVLLLKSWGHVDPSAFGWFEGPPAESIEAAERLLVLLGATDPTGGLTEIGRMLVDLPIHPRLGRLLAGAAACGDLDRGADLAAILSERDLLPIGDPRAPRPLAAPGDSDLIPRMDALDMARRERFSPRLRDRGIDPIAARQASEVAADLRRIGRRFGANEGPDGSNETLRQLALLAYPDRVCRRRETDPAAALMVGGRGVRLDPSSVVRAAELFLAIDPRDAKRLGKRESAVRIASAIEPEWLDEAFPGSIRRERTVRFEESRGRAVALDSIVYRDLPLREDTHGKVAEEEASQALAEWLIPRAPEFFRADEAASAWLDRLEFLSRFMPEAALPALDHEALREVVTAACHGRRTIEEVRRAPLVPLLRGRLSYAQAKLMDDEAPESIAVPTGNRIRLRYEPGRPPVLAVRLQELFGLADTPRIAGGRVPVLLHLLGPNHRPVQVTEDLRSFWTTTYFQVRKDLRNRYPKHSWPEDPRTAPPVARGRNPR